MACHYWKEGSPFIFTREDMKDDRWKISVVADVSCDIDGPVACTVEPSTIADPMYGYHIADEKRIADFRTPGTIAVMAVDNLPCELPKDASEDFGAEMIKNVLPHLFERMLMKSFGKRPRPPWKAHLLRTSPTCKITWTTPDYWRTKVNVMCPSCFLGAESLLRKIQRCAYFTDSSKRQVFEGVGACRIHFCLEQFPVLPHNDGHFDRAAHLAAVARLGTVEQIAILQAPGGRYVALRVGVGDVVKAAAFVCLQSDLRAGFGSISPRPSANSWNASASNWASSSATI